MLRATTRQFLTIIGHPRTQRLAILKLLKPILQENSSIFVSSLRSIHVVSNFGYSAQLERAVDRGSL